MKNELKVTILLLFIVNANCFAQNIYYKVNGGKTIDEKNYTELKENLSNQGKIEVFNLKTISKKDSIINYLKIMNLTTTPDGYDPWGETKKFIGTKFQIEKFVNNNSQNFKNDYLEGKPTLLIFGLRDVHLV
jgi:hypothetical protein